jgi:hypothetical protein
MWIEIASRIVVGVELEVRESKRGKPFPKIQQRGVGGEWRRQRRVRNRSGDQEASWRLNQGGEGRMLEHPAISIKPYDQTQKLQTAQVGRTLWSLFYLQMADS